MAISNFIPTIWSENLLTSLDEEYIGVANCTREYEGEIKGRGSVVKICGVGDITVGDYTKDTDMSNPQTLSDTVRELTIDQAKYFNFQVDDIDRTQCSPRLLDAAMKNAAMALARQADKHVYSLHPEASQTVYAQLSGVDMMTVLFNMRDTLMTGGVSEASDIIIEIHPVLARFFLTEKSNMISDNTSIMETGCIGNFYGSKVFVSRNIELIEKDGVPYFCCFMRTKRAIAFAEQLSEIDAYRPEKRFADAVKGLHLYGAKVIRPEEFICVAMSPN